uniref:Ammonium transporter AmtB-like domain-containing protein n=1 Tax=Naja naja TaxID=35670 RepID=A0A8C6X299_NAJNA
MSRVFSTSLRCRLPVLLFVFQGVLLLIFVLFTTYDGHTDAASQPSDVDPAGNQLYAFFSLFQDIQLMLLVGLGLLLAFMKGYGVSAVAYNFLLSNFCMQWALIVQGFIYHYHEGKIHLGLYNLLTAEFATVAVLISAGAILGRTTSEWLILSYFQAVDIGGSVTVHVFSCYFGLGASIALYRSGLQTGHPKETPSYISDLLSLVGAIFLWVFWPSFVSVLVHPGDGQHRAVLHTWVALSASVLTTFAISSLLEKKGKVSMGHLQNATLAGGVAIGTVADMAINPGGAFLLGILSSLACILGFKYMTPFLANKLRIQDQCGIHNLHGLPGIIGAVAGIATIFASQQALFQAVGLGVSVIISLVGGYLTGLLLKLPFLAQPPDQFCFDDELYFQIQKPLETLSVDQVDEDLQIHMTHYYYYYRCVKSTKALLG